MSATLTPGVEAPVQTPRKKRELKQLDFWTIVTLALLVLFGAFLIFPLWQVLKESVVNGEGEFTLQYFVDFFAKSYYFSTIYNSFVLSIAVTLVSLAIGIPFSYFYTYFKLRGQKLLFIGAVLSCMSAPFIGAYAWILLMGRNGLVTQIMGTVFPWIEMGSIYGFGGLVFVLSLKLFPLVSVYMNGAFRSIDNSLLEAASLMGSSGLKRILTVTLRLTVPTMLAASLLVFMRTFADFGTPLLIGEGYRTFTVEIYNQYLGETGTNHNFAAAIGVIGVIVTAIVFWFQKYAAGKFSFTLKASAPIQRIKPRGLKSIGMHVYMYVIVGLAFLPQIYVMYLSFRKSNASVFLPGYSFQNYENAMDRLLVRSTLNTLWFGTISMAIIIVLSVLIAYLVVRRSNFANNFIDTMAMIPYILPGAVIGIALILAFNGQPLALTGTAAIMILALVIRRMPYTIRSATATLMHIPMSMEEASRSLGASKLKTFRKITVPMMANGITSGAILSFVAIVTEMAAGIILYNNQTITLTMSAYVAITRGNYGLACAFSTVLTVLTAIVLLVYLKFTREEDVKM